jgi:hypothetical protein
VKLPFLWHRSPCRSITRPSHSTCKFKYQSYKFAALSLYSHHPPVFWQSLRAQSALKTKAVCYFKTLGSEYSIMHCPNPQLNHKNKISQQIYALSLLVIKHPVKYILYSGCDNDATATWGDEYPHATTNS